MGGSGANGLRWHNVPRASLDVLLWTFSKETMSFTWKHYTGVTYSRISLARDLYSKGNSFTLLDLSTYLMAPRTLLAL